MLVELVSFFVGILRDAGVFAGVGQSTAFAGAISASQRSTQRLLSDNAVAKWLPNTEVRSSIYGRVMFFPVDGGPTLQGVSVLASVRSAIPCTLARYAVVLVVRKFCCCKSLQLCAAKCNRAQTHYESAALTAELRARALISTTCRDFGTRGFFTVVEIVWTSEAPPLPRL